ncbi:hypothetical protein TYRP_014952 [Tyrophagus putrescentiae]|nr:hypothetical protein TYRP_014952 [Tyrophagus putrescentiae]
MARNYEAINDDDVLERAPLGALPNGAQHRAQTAVEGKEVWLGEDGRHRVTAHRRPHPLRQTAISAIVVVQLNQPLQGAITDDATLD